MMRMTKNRQQVYDTLVKSHTPLTAYEISKMLDEMSLTTVYRALDYLYEEGQVKYFVLNDFKYYYVSVEHKHFFQCEKCKKLFVLDECLMENYERYIEDHLGFKVSEHFVFFTGLCKECQELSQFSQKEVGV